MNQHSQEIIAGDRFKFGENWLSFLRVLNDKRIVEAEKSLKTLLEVDSLEGKSFLDVGSGSGLFSLAARRLGARVHSLDYDPQSVACTRELKLRYFPNDGQWIIDEGSVLDEKYLNALGTFDIVYSWGVLHHTGAMWTAMENIAPLVARGGKLYIAIYNDQILVSSYWKLIKKLYNNNKVLRFAILLVHIPYFYGVVLAYKVITRQKKLSRRGMSYWHDLKDWLGGWPFEVAKPESIFDFYRERGYTLSRMKTCGGKHGCNEFVFVR